jgi:putative hydrolase of the HAD superfamily
MSSGPAILFDFGGTLDADGIRWAVRFHEAYREAGGELPFALFEDLFRESDRLLAQFPGIGGLGFRATVEAQISILADLLPERAGVDLSRIAEGFYSASVVVARRNAGLLGRLSPAWRLGVISNFTGNLRPCLEELGLATYFTALLDSELEGARKPDRRLFDRALVRLGADPDRTWMVGDSPEADVRPALQLGLRACWLTQPDRPLPDGLRPTARIAHLPELASVLVA